MSWKRRLFFIFEKLKITPAERKSVAVLLLMLVILASANLLIKPGLSLDEEHYAALKAEFVRRSNKIKLQQNDVLARYYPPQNSAADTLPTPDSASTGTPQKASVDINTKININTADIKALQKLAGIGPAYAQRIIDYRNAHGGISTIEELKKVKGIGRKRLEKIKPFIKLKE